MNRALRQAHFRTFLALALALPIACAAALSARSQRPIDPAAADLAAIDGTPDADATDVSARFAPIGVRAAFSSSARRVWLESAAPLAEPDVLVYAGSTPPGPDRRLPADARLLGALPQTGRRSFALREGANVVVLYSLGHQVVIGAGSVEGGGAR